MEKELISTVGGRVIPEADIYEYTNLVGEPQPGGDPPVKAYKIYIINKYEKPYTPAGELLKEFFGVGETEEDALWNSGAAEWIVEHGKDKSDIEVLYNCLGKVDVELY